MSPAYRLDKWAWLTIRACKDSSGAKRLHRIMELRAMHTLKPEEGAYVACMILTKCLEARESERVNLLELIRATHPSEMGKYGAVEYRDGVPAETGHFQRFALVLMSQVRMTVAAEWPDYPAPAKWRDDQP